MSSSISQNLGVSLSAVLSLSSGVASYVGTGTTIANISTIAGATQNDGTTQGSFMSGSYAYTQIGVATSTNYAYTLPINPSVGQVYTIRNDGVFTVQLFPSTTTSTINTAGGASGAGLAIPIPPNGGVVSLICNGSNGALNSATGANPYNNPAISWNLLTSNGNVDAPVFSTATTSTSLTLTKAQSGSTVLLAIFAANCIINLPAVTGCAGVNYKFIQTGVATHTCTITPTTSVLYGGLINSLGVAAGDAAIVLKSAGASFVFTAAAVIGDYATVQSDGVNWYVNGLSNAATAGFT